MPQSRSGWIMYRGINASEYSPYELGSSKRARSTEVKPRIAADNPWPINRIDPVRIVSAAIAPSRFVISYRHTTKKELRTRPELYLAIRGESQGEFNKAKLARNSFTSFFILFGICNKAIIQPFSLILAYYIDRESDAGHQPQNAIVGQEYIQEEARVDEKIGTD